MDRVVKPYTFADIRDARFGEIIVVKPDGADIYNTTGMNDCPPELWDTMDIEKLGQELGAQRIQKNGPHFWVMDSQTVAFGETMSFGGLEARWGATIDPRQLGSQGSAPYALYYPKKTQNMVYSKGKPVYELVDPDGYAYVLQAHDERFTLQSLATLGEQMKSLPTGWLYRTRVLDEELIIDLTPDKTTYGVGDEFHQYYTRIPALNR